jgi:hypothetical protein
MAKKYDLDAYSPLENLMASAATKPFTSGSQSGAFYDYNSPLVKQLQDMQNQGKGFSELEAYYKANSTPQTTQKFNNMNEAYAANGYDASKVINSNYSTPIASQQQALPTNQQKSANSVTPQQQLIDVQKQQQINGLKTAYEGQRSGARADSTMQAKDFENFLANKGISSSGSAGQGEIARNVALQGATSNSQLQQQKSIEGVEAQALQNQVAEQQRQDDIAREQQRYNQQQSMQQQQYQQSQYQQGLDNAYRQQQFNYNQQQDTAQQANQQQQNQYQQQQQALDLQQQQQQAYQQQAKVLAQANYTNIQDLINSLQPNDPLIPFLQAERQAKIQNDGLDQSGFKLPVAPKQMTYEQALNTWKAYGVASQEIADMLGVPAGAKTIDYQEMQYTNGKPYFAPKAPKAPSTSSGNGSTPWYLK